MHGFAGCPHAVSPSVNCYELKKDKGDGGYEVSETSACLGIKLLTAFSVDDPEAVPSILPKFCGWKPALNAERLQKLGE